MSSGTNGEGNILRMALQYKSKSNLNSEKRSGLARNCARLWSGYLAVVFSNPIIHLNIPDLVPALAEALIAARSGGYFPCAGREHWRRIDSSVLAISQNTLVAGGPHDSNCVVEFSRYSAGEWDRFQLKPYPAIAGSRFAA
jgi:hypothetical protein